MPVIHFERVRFRASSLEERFFLVTPKEDEGTVVATENTLSVEILYDPLDIVATASFPFTSALGNSGTGTGTGAFTSSQAISNPGTVTALAAHTGTETVI